MKKYLALFICLLLIVNTVTPALAANFMLPAGLTVIDEEAFSDVPITGVMEVSGKVTEVNNGAFRNTEITALILGEGIETVGSNVAKGSNAVYVLVKGEDTVVASDAFDGVPYVICADESQAGGAEYCPAGDVVCVDGLYYLLNGDDTATLLFAKDPDAVSGEITVPETVEGCAVTGVSEYAFANCGAVKAVYLPDSVEDMPSANKWPGNITVTGNAPMIPDEGDGAIKMEMSGDEVFLLGDEPRVIGMPGWFPDGMQQFYSSNTNVAAVSQDGRIRPVGLGNATVTVYIRAEDGLYYGSVRVSVVEPEAEYEVYGLDDAGKLHITAGQTDNVRYSAVSNYGLDDVTLTLLTSYESADENILTIDKNGFMTAHSAGETTITMSAQLTDDYSISAEVPVVVEEGMHMLNSSIYAYCDEQVALTVENLPEGAECEWYSENEDVFHVESVDGNTAVLRCHWVDGEQWAMAVCRVKDAEGNDIGELGSIIHVKPYNFYITGDDGWEYRLICGDTVDIEALTGIHPEVDRWWLHDDEPINVTWESSDESLISFDGSICTIHDTEYPEWVEVICRAETMGHVEERHINIEVRRTELYACVETDFIDMHVGEERGFGYWYEGETRVTEMRFTSSDENIVTVDAHGRLIGVNPGEAVVTYTVEDFAGVTAEARIHVLVHGNEGTVKLLPETATMNVGESMQMNVEFDLPEGVYVRGYDFYTNDDSIAVVDGYYLYAKAPGTVSVHYNAHLTDDNMIPCVSYITVKDASSPLELNANFLEMERYDSFKLTAAFNGVDVSADAEWTTEADGFIAMGENGEFMLADVWSSDYLPHVVCTYVADGVEYTAKCAVKCLPQRFRIDNADGTWMLAAGERGYLNISAVNLTGEEVRCEWISEDPSVLAVESLGGYSARVTGISAGKTNVRLTVYDSKGKILDQGSYLFFVDIAFEDPTAISFTKDHYIYPLAEGEWLPEWIIPEVVLDTDDPVAHALVRLSSDNPELIDFEEGGWPIYNFGTGEATITATVAGYPQLSAEAKVTITRAEMTTDIEPEQIRTGDIVTFTFEGIPEDFEYMSLEWDYDDGCFEEVSRDYNSITLMAVRDWETWVHAHMRVYENLGVTLEKQLWIGRNDLHFDWDILKLDAGEDWGIWPEFEFGDAWVWETSNEKVADIEVIETEDGNEYIIHALSEGKAYITLSYTDENGERAEARVLVIVAGEPVWDIIEINMPDIMYVGMDYDISAYVEYSSEIWPEISLVSSDPEVIEVIDDGGYIFVRPLKAGKATLTLTGVKKDGEGNVIVEDSASKEFTVVAAPVHMNERYPNVYMGDSFQLEVINNTDKAIKSIEWSSTCEDSAVVDANGLLTMVGEPSRYGYDVEIVVTAKVTFEDDSVAYALCYPYIIRRIQINYHEGDTYIEMQEGGMPGQTHLGIYFESDLSPEQLFFWWQTHDDRIAVIGDQDWRLMGTEQDENGEDCYYYYYCEAYVFGVNQGECAVNFHAESYLGEMADYDIGVQVANPHFNLDEIELNTPADFEHYAGDRVGMPVENVILGVGYDTWIELPGEADDAIVYYYSSDENVAVVGQNGLVRGVGAGNAAITVIMRRNDGWVCYGVVGVMVVEPRVDMIIGNLNDEGVLELTVGETHILSFGMDANIPIGGYELGGMSTLTSADENIVAIGDKQYFTAVGVGETTVTMHSQITDDYSIDTVIPVSVTEGAMVMSHAAVRIYDGEQVQLSVLNLPEGATCEWFTENGEFANVDENGLVTAAEGIEAACFIYCNVFDAEGNLLTEEPLDCRINIFPISLVFEDRGENESPVFMIGEFNFFDHYEIVPAAYGWYYDYDPEIKVWCESSDPSVISVAEDGVTCKTNKLGECVITCYIEALGRTASKEYRIFVQEGYVHAELHDRRVDIEVGDSYNIGYYYWTDFNVDSVVFTTSDPSVFTVSADGRIDAVDRGEATLTMTVTDYAGTTATATAQVRVRGAKVSLKPETAVINVGEMIQFIPEYADYDDGANLRYSNLHVHNDDIASFSDHYVYAKSAGTTFVQLDAGFDNGIHTRAFSVLTVVDPENALQLNENRLVLKPYHTAQLEATFNGEPVSNVTWTSTDSEFASVDGNGLVTLRNCWDEEYIAEIICTYEADGEAYTASCGVMGQYQDVRIVDVPDYIMINTGDRRYLLAGLESDGTGVEGVTFEWSIIEPEGDEAYVPAVSIVDNRFVDGVASGVAELLCKAVDAEGNVLDCRVLTVFVDIPADTGAEIAFDQQSYLILMEEDNDHIHDWMQPRIVLNTPFGDLYNRMEYNVEEGSAAFYDGDWLCWTGEEGTVTIGVSVRGYPELHATAEVTIRRLEVTQSAEEIMQGETFRMVASGIPANVEPEEVYWEADDGWVRMIESGRDEESGEYYAVFVGQGDWYDNVRFYCRLENGNDFEIHRGVQIHGAEFRFNDRAVKMSPNEEFEIWPEFELDPNEWHWESTDENIAVGETRFNDEHEGCSFIVKTFGNGVVTLNFVHNEDANMRAVVTVTVTDDEWELKRIDIPDVLILGNGYSLDAWIESNSYVWPEMRWESDDPSVIQINQDEWRAFANATGKATVTLTCEKNGEIQSTSKTITVIEPEIRLDDPYPSIRAGKSFTVTLQIREDIKDQVESISWTSTCEDAATVQPAEDDPCKGVITFSETYFEGRGDEYSIYVIATVTLKDGTILTTYCTPDLIPEWDLRFDLNHLDDRIDLGVGEFGDSRTGTLNFWFSTNLTEEEFYIVLEGPHDGSVAKITDTRLVRTNGEDGYRFEIDVEALAEGETDIGLLFKSVDMEHFHFEHGHNIHVTVRNPRFEIMTNEQEITIGTGEVRHLDRWYDTFGTDGHGAWNPTVWTSADPSIAIVDSDGRVTGVNPGTTTITHTVWSNGNAIMDSLDYTVNVMGVTLNETELTLNPGECADLIYTGVNVEVTGWGWESLNENVAMISSNGDGNGTVAAIAPGTAVIRLGVDCHDENDNGYTAWAYCTVTVPYAEDEPLKLSETNLVLPSEQTAKLEYTLADGIVADSVEWFTMDENVARIDQEGNITANYCDHDKMYTRVGVTVNQGENIYTATCLVTVKTANYRLSGFDGMWGTHVGGEHSIGMSDDMCGNYTATKRFVSDDENIAVVCYDENGNPYILGVSQGITDIHCIVELDNGEVYTSTVTMYVNTEFPEIEAFHIADTLYLTAPEMERHLSWRYMPWWTEPHGIPVEITYQVPEDADQGIIYVHEDGNIEALQPGTTWMDVTVHGYPELCTSVKVVVLDNIYGVAGKEGDVYRPGDQVQLSIENWDGPVRFQCYYPDNQVRVTEDGLLTILDPCDEVYDLYAWMMFDDGESLEYRYEFRIEDMLNNSESAYYAVNNFAIAYPDQLGEMDMRVSEPLAEQIAYETLESKDTEIAVVEGERFMRTLKPGNAHFVRRAYNEQDEEIASLDFYFTVQEDAAPELYFSGARVIKVGEVLGMWPEVRNGSYFGIDWWFESADESILISNGYDEGWQTHTFTGVKEGVVDVTLYGRFSENGQVGSVTLPVYVVAAE